MNPVLSQPSLAPATPVALGNSDISGQVWNLLSSLYPQVRRVERRSSQRFSFAHLIRLTPVSPAGQPLQEGRLVVTGKNLSEQGICFYHAQPLALRRAIVSLEAGNGAWISFLTDLTWCRFTHHGWYESGGLFLEAVGTPAGIDKTRG